MNVPVPENASDDYWAGALAEARARDGALSPGALEVRSTLEALDELRQQPAADLVAALARIYCPGLLKRRHRAA